MIIVTHVKFSFYMSINIGTIIKNRLLASNVGYQKQMKFVILSSFAGIDSKCRNAMSSMVEIECSIMLGL